MSGHQFELAECPTDHVSAVKFAPSSPHRLLVASWDKFVYLYDTQADSGGALLNKFEHNAPVQDVCFGRDDNEAFSCLVDGTVNRVNLETGEISVMSQHAKGARSVVASAHHNVLVSGSWDLTLHLHRLDDTSGSHTTVSVPAKVFCMSVSPTKVVVAMSNRANNIYELSDLAAAADKGGNVEVEPYQRRESSMKYMTRAVACMPNDAGYASSSIEGRVAVEWFDPSDESQSRKYAFKCHRQNVDGQDVVYPVHALVYHPVYHGTFASGGGDGTAVLWDGVTKRRIKQFPRFPASVNSIAFSSNGKFVAFGVSPGFEDGKEDDTEGAIKVFIRALGDNEAQGKKK
ncbi:WD40 repeat-like protein [Amniculicola lignicola CBS 123094]|uniref:WD40 repeat-like protein n=1 Tax=Amniculicola lignicola CBS 123094 TaxID=1392246 RepID=A0A6A5W6W4_9PLEO|nr:WD40 repeat-like protein [Amniculicola lignicola CBS 123094]